MIFFSRKYLTKLKTMVSALITDYMRGFYFALSKVKSHFNACHLTCPIPVLLSEQMDMLCTLTETEKSSPPISPMDHVRKFSKSFMRHVESLAL